MKLDIKVRVGQQPAIKVISSLAGAQGLSFLKLNLVMLVLQTYRMAWS